MYNIINKGGDAKLNGAATASSVILSTMTIQRPLDQLLHTLALANELLPPLSPCVRLASLIDKVSTGTQAAQDVFGAQPSPGCLEAYARDNSQTIVSFGTKLFPVFVDISGTIVNDAIRLFCVRTQCEACVVDPFSLARYTFRDYVPCTESLRWPQNQVLGSSHKASRALPGRGSCCSYRRVATAGIPRWLSLLGLGFCRWPGTHFDRHASSEAPQSRCGVLPTPCSSYNRLLGTDSTRLRTYQ